MAREKGTGNLQQEKSGRWTIRVGINGRRLSRSTGTRDRDKAEAFLNRFLAPMGLGAIRLPLAEAWHHYEMSPNRRDVAKTTLASKRTMWMCFARWMEQNHIEIGNLAEVTETAVGEYLAEFRCHHSATTYNNHVCALREVFRTLAEKAGVTHDPWAGVCLRSDDSVSRRELTLDEVERLYSAASKEGAQWKLLVMVGIYTGLRLGDCCRLSWECVNLERQVIQVIPEKTKKHMHGRPITIPIHGALLDALQTAMHEVRGKREEGREGTREEGKEGTREEGTGKREEKREDGVCSGTNATSAGSSFSLLPLTSSLSFVNPTIAELYLNRKWQIAEGLRKIFKMANITMSVRLEGRSRKSVVASFHSLRHTFVSLSANAGVPLPVVQSIVGHCSTAMTRHYYHENLDALRSAVASIPVIGKREKGRGKSGDGFLDTSLTGLTELENGEKREGRSPLRPRSVESRLKRLGLLLSKGLITQEEHDLQRARILSEL
jgi:integrase